MTYKKLIVILIFITVVAFFLYHYFFYTDPQSGCFIKIPPSFQGGNTKAKKAIKIIKINSPDDYKNLCKYIKTIDLFSGAAGGAAGLYWEKLNPHAILVNSMWYFQFFVEMIAHETCHATQHFEGRPYSEEECYKKGDVLIKK